MSRLHDALKKAEQEKVLLGDPESLVETMAPGGSGRQNQETAKIAANHPLATEAASGAGQDEWLPAAFLRPCCHRDWNTDSTLTQQVDARRHTLVSEEFRTLRSRLYLIRKTRPLQKLLVTSPLPQEGKSFVATNLARIFAKQSDTRVLLIDSDLRVSAVHVLLGAPATPGLSEYLGGGLDLTSMIQRGPAKNFFFIPGGATAANPTELLGNGRFEPLMKRLAAVFDWIIIDSPPAIPVSDARLLAGFCDGVLMLVNAGTTPFDLAQRACGAFPKDQLLGVILNRAEQGQNYSAYYYYGKGNHHNGNGKRERA
jgi:capsular exopolysaccharide synthesis family protein